jgi:hypothetical protein
MLLLTPYLNFQALSVEGIPVELVLDTAAAFIMREVDLVLTGAQVQTWIHEVLDREMQGPVCQKCALTAAFAKCGTKMADIFGEMSVEKIHFSSTGHFEISAVKIIRRLK